MHYCKICGFPIDSFGCTNLDCKSHFEQPMKFNANIEKLLNFAEAVREKAYAPYSNFKVGAAIQSTDGKIFTGCNIENISYSLTMCAERVALGNFIVNGNSNSKIETIVIAGSSNNICYPCGACLQVLSEFGNPFIYCFNNEGIGEHYYLNEALRGRFKK